MSRADLHWSKGARTASFMSVVNNAADRPWVKSAAEAIRDIGKSLLALALVTSSALLACLLLSLPHLTTH